MGQAVPSNSVAFKEQSLKRSTLPFSCSFSVRPTFTKHSRSVRSAFVHRSQSVHRSFEVQRPFTFRLQFAIIIVLWNFNRNFKGRGIIFIVRKGKKKVYVRVTGKYKSEGHSTGRTQQKLQSGH
jgi:hypothetical protein